MIGMNSGLPARGLDQLGRGVCVKHVHLLALDLGRLDSVGGVAGEQLPA